MSWSISVSGHDGDGNPENDHLQEVVDAAVEAATSQGLVPTTTVVNGTIQGVSVGPVSTDLTNGEQVLPDTAFQGTGQPTADNTQGTIDNTDDDDIQYPPRKNDNKEAWIAYAVANGETQEAAEDMTKEELVDKYSADA